MGRQQSFVAQFAFPKREQTTNGPSSTNAGEGAFEMLKYKALSIMK